MEALIRASRGHDELDEWRSVMNNRGLWYALGAYLLWGVIPIFWKQFHGIPALEITAHRVIWSFVLCALVVTLARRWPDLRAAFAVPRTWLTFVATAALLLLNWLVYIWAINADMILETSLGYFINPLVNVLLGVLFLRERLRSGQWIAVGLAAIAVLWLTFTHGGLPWVALTLAFTFGFYGLFKKTADLGSLEGLTLEMGYLFIPMLGYVILLSYRGAGSMDVSQTRESLLFMATGVMTALPLLLFSAGARLVPLSMLGVLQYIAPTMQFFIGVFYYHEPFSQALLIGFMLIWVALAVYSVEGMLHRRTRLRTTVPPPDTAEPAAP